MPDGSVLHTHAKGAVQLHDLGEGVALHACLGVTVAEFAPLVIAEGDRLLREHGRIAFFVDGYDAKMMSTGFREQITAWVAERGDAVACAHVLIRSKLWEMGLSIAKLVMRDTPMHVHSDVGEWEAAGRRQAAGFTRRPLILPADLR